MSAVRTKKGVLFEELLLYCNEIGTPSFRGTGMGHSQHLSVINQASDPAVNTVNYSYRWLQVKISSCLKGVKIGGLWSSIEATKYISVLELKAIYLALPFFNKGTKFKVNAFLNRQYMCPHTSSENVWYTQSGNNENSKGDFEFSAGQGYGDHSGVSAKQIECADRSIVLKENGFFRKDAKSKGFSEDLSENSSSKNILFYIKVAPSNNKKFDLWKLDPLSLGTDAF